MAAKYKQDLEKTNVLNKCILLGQGEARKELPGRPGEKQLIFYKET